MAYSSELKASIVQKALSTNKPKSVIAKENGINVSSLRRWIQEHRKSGVLSEQKEEKRPNDWSAEERISALIETGSMSDEDRGIWCRKHGLHTHHLERWKNEAISGVMKKRTGSGSRGERRLRQEVKELKKELRRKEKALAETAALLVLKKKAQSIWGDEEDD